MTMETEMVINQPVQPEEISDLKEKGQSLDKNVLDQFTDQGGLFDLSVKQMLQQGHEGELSSWLKEMNLIRSSMNCPNETCQGKSLSWSQSRTVDKYCWLCTECKKKQSIRDSSFFVQIKCDLKLCMQIILAWCRTMPAEAIANYLEIKPHVVKKVFEKLGKIVEQYVNNHIDEWHLGGPGKILIVDEFPGGYMTETLINSPVPKRRNNNNCHTILCIAEVELEQIPPRMWMHIIEANPGPSSKKDKAQKIEAHCGMVEEALNEISMHARPGSFLIANRRARCCNYESVKELQGYKVISLEDLQTYDPPGKNDLLSNLETIWQTGIGFCEEVQETTRANGLQHLYVHLWRQRFAVSTAAAFEQIIQQIPEYYKFT